LGGKANHAWQKRNCADIQFVIFNLRFLSARQNFPLHFLPFASLEHAGQVVNLPFLLNSTEKREKSRL